jgi:phosphatidylserine decarboxylase
MSGHERHGTDEQRAGDVPAVSPDVPGLPWRATLALLARLPQAALSRGLGRLADAPVPRSARRSVLGAFARSVGIDVAEAELPLDEYGSVNEFFVRRLRPGVRAWPHDDTTIASPVDGIVGRHGTIRDGRLIQAKGRFYSAAALLASERDAAAFEGGSFLTIYLSPRHYHRIHAPCSGRIIAARYVPGALLPVNEPAVLHVADLFPRNERVICCIEGPLGRTAVVAVGAYNVGRISTAFDPDWAGPGGSVANRRASSASTRRYDPPVAVRQGDEIMAFHLGSTIILMTEPGPRIEALAGGSEVRLGDAVMHGSPAGA